MIDLLIGIVQFAAKLITFLIFIRVILSFVSPDPYNPIVQWVYRLSDPIFNLFGRVRIVIGMFDFTPILILFLIQIVSQIIIRMLLMLR